MINQIQVCNKCKSIKKEDIEFLKANYSDCQIFIGCCNLCGIGRTKPFVIYNHIPIIADTFQEVIKQLEDKRKS